MCIYIYIYSVIYIYQIVFPYRSEYNILYSWLRPVFHRSVGLKLPELCVAQVIHLITSNHRVGMLFLA